jgi:hypothetical protein
MYIFIFLIWSDAIRHKIFIADGIIIARKFYDSFHNDFIVQ